MFGRGSVYCGCRSGERSARAGCRFLNCQLPDLGDAQTFLFCVLFEFLFLLLDLRRSGKGT